VGNGGEVRRFREELDAMQANEILSPAQVRRVLSALAAISDQTGANR
jgi:hypothetical protein